jgi:Ca-activated chloride channel family protein
MPDNFEIAYPWIFILILLPVFIYWLAPAFRIKSASLQVPNLEKTASLTGLKPKDSALVTKKNKLVSFLLFIIWVLILMTLSSPRLVGEPELKIKTSRNFLIVADISFSMANSDWVIEGKRTTRWEAVKSVMHEFIEKRTGDRMGLIFFGSSAYVQVPFTSDLKTMELLLEEADVGMAGQMTNIGKAVVKGIEMFDQDTIKTKVMLVLTDGVDSGTEILPLDAADLAKKDSIHIYTLGIGDPENSGSDLDEQTLKEISEMTDARYFRAIDTEQLSEIYAELDKLEPIEYEEETFIPATLLYYYPLTLAIVLTLILSLMLGIVSLLKNKRDG